VFFCYKQRIADMVFRGQIIAFAIVAFGVGEIELEFEGPFIDVPGGKPSLSLSPLPELRRSG
jgi:hypothetical protein